MEGGTSDPPEPPLDLPLHLLNGYSHCMQIHQYGTLSHMYID